ncbi:MAG: hypothetical protein U0228_06040 [Myxococcaceae bacterium]
MTLLALVAALALTQKPAPAAPPAQPAPPAVDVSGMKDSFALLTDGKGHYLAWDLKATTANLFVSGDGKTFSRVRLQGGSKNGLKQWSASVWDPRMFHGDGRGAFVYMNDPAAPDDTLDAGAPTKDTRTWSVSCAAKTTPVTLVPAAEAKKIIDAATWVGPTWTRLPEKLFRDDSGNYYLVDRFRTDSYDDRRDFRVFIGPRGNMKQAPLKDIVDDSMGLILSTKNGNLRLVTTGTGTTEPKSEAKWIQGKEATPLTEVDLGRYDSARMVYLELGPYNGQRLGTPCDDFM